MSSRQKERKTFKVSLDEFENQNYDTWRESVEAQLKGAPFEKKLVKKSSEKIDVQPLYSKNVYSQLADEMPGSFPFTRGVSPLPKTPNVCQQISAVTPQQLNAQLVNNTKRGQNAVYIKLDRYSRQGVDPNTTADLGEDGVSISTSEDIELILNGLDLANLYLHIEMGIAGSAGLALLAGAIDNLGFKSNELKGAILYDPHQQLLVEGELNIELDALYGDLAKMLKVRNSAFNNFAIIGVDVANVRESGGSATEELSIAMASAVDYIRGLSKYNFRMDEIAPVFQFSMTSGVDFFMEIAKFRAGRRLWAQIVASCQGNADKAPFKVTASGQHWNKTVYDPYVNMLRSTTESFAAMLGGVENLNSIPFDEVFSTPDEFSQRIARNTQIVLDEESHVNEVIDPAGGSWYIESLTNELVKKSWQLFQKIEEQGGFVKAVQNGFIQQTIAEVAKQKKQKIATRKDGIIGTSLFANINEELPREREAISTQEKEDYFNSITERKKNRNDQTVTAALNKIEKENAYFEALMKAAASGATLQELHQSVFSHNSDLRVTPLKRMRASEDYEVLREKSEKYKQAKGDYPAIVLATIGPLRQHKLRADFVANFVTPAGFRTVESGVDSDAAKILETVKSCSSKIVVICSTDDTYAGCVPDIAQTLKSYDKSIQVLVAGYPKEIINDLTAAGADDFLHIKSNNLLLLQQFQQKAGVA